jgi:hypothetical protein
VHRSVSTVDRQKPNLAAREFFQYFGEIFRFVRFDEKIAQCIGRALAETIAVAAISQAAGIADEAELHPCGRGAPQMGQLCICIDNGMIKLL